MKLIFLGTGASSPTPKRYTSSILLHVGHIYTLLDCGEGAQIRLQQVGVDVLKLRYVMITHKHGDHAYGLQPLLDSFLLKVTTQNISGKVLTIYAPKDICDEILSKFKIQNHLIECVSISTKDDVETDFIELEKLKAKFIRMYHGDTETYGVYIEAKNANKNSVSLFYSGDGICLEDCIKVLKMLHPCILIHEASFLDYPHDISKAREKHHATVADAAFLAKEIGSQVLVLTHISARYRESLLKDYISRARKVFSGDIILAEDLSTMVLSKIHCRYD
jgi:ribonuclease Z